MNYYLLHKVCGSVIDPPTQGINIYHSLLVHVSFYLPLPFYINTLFLQQEPIYIMYFTYLLYKFPRTVVHSPEMYSRKHIKGREADYTGATGVHEAGLPSLIIVSRFVGCHCKAWQQRTRLCPKLPPFTVWEACCQFVLLY